MIVGKDASVTGAIDVIPSQDASQFAGSYVKILANTCTTISNVRVGYVETFESAVVATGYYQLYGIGDATVTLGESGDNNSVNFYGCKNSITINADKAKSAPFVAFNNCEKATLNINGYNDSTNALNVATAKNITIKNSSFKQAVALNATGNISLEGNAKNGTKVTETHNDFNSNMSLTAGGNITVDGYNIFKQVSTTMAMVMTLNAGGTVSFTGNGSSVVNAGVDFSGLKTSALDLYTQATVKVESANAFTMTNVKVGIVKSYVDAELTNCLITARNSNQLLRHNWTYSESPAKVTFKLVYDGTTALSDKDLKTFFAAPAMDNGGKDAEGNTIKPSDSVKADLADSKAWIVFKKGNGESEYPYSKLASLNI